MGQTSTKSDKKKTVITGDVSIADLVELYPQVVDFLIIEYGFHCVSCFLAGYENLEEGAKVHGIVGEDFQDMLKDINKIANGEKLIGEY